MEFCNFHITHIKEIIQQDGFALFFRQGVQSFGKQLCSNFFSCYNKGLFSFIICEILVANKKLLFFL